MNQDEQNFEIETDDDDALDDVVELASGRVPPLKAIRRHCLDCCNGSSNEVALCVSTGCSLWLYRRGKNPTPEMVQSVADVQTHPRGAPAMSQGELMGFTPLRAIRRRCHDCSGGNSAEIRRCPFGPEARNSCDLHEHRMRGGSKRRTASEADLERLRAFRESRSQ